MRISELGRQPVRPRAFWVAVLCVVALLGAMGLYFMQTGHVPEFPHWLLAAMLAFVWVMALVQMLRYGRKVLSLSSATILVGYTLFIGGELVPHAGRAVALAGDIGGLLLVVAGLAPFVTFGKPSPSDAPSDGPT